MKGYLTNTRLFLAIASQGAMFVFGFGRSPTSLLVECNDTSPACHSNKIDFFDGSERQSLTKHTFSVEKTKGLLYDILVYVYTFMYAFLARLIA